MRLPHESKEELNSVERAWEFLAGFDFTPANATLERHAVYTFAASWAERWRKGRVLLAGDAAHLMPPFAGQGMCSGMRDAANLAWKLDLVLKRKSPEVLLDTYGIERLGHVQNAIGMSVALGNVICVTDPKAVAERDAGMIAAGAAPEKILPPLPPPTLSDGVVHRLADGSPQAGAGTLVIQGRVARGESIARFDTVVGTGFVVLASGDPRRVLDGAQLRFLESIDARLVQLLAPGDPGLGDRADAVCDIDSVYLPHFSRAEYEAVIVRPDFYVFGMAHAMADLPALVEDLRFQLSGGSALQPGATADRAASVALP
jgi:flavoprotein hydroxylase